MDKLISNLIDPEIFSTTSYKIKRILILGNTGFIGSHIEKKLRQFFPDKEIIGQSVRHIDLTEEESIKKLEKVLSPETAVVMCAAIKKQLGDNLSTFQKNIKIVINVCQALQHSTVARFIYFSSAAVYGEDVQNTTLTEETPVAPISYYGIAKYISECLLLKVFQELGKEKIVILRPAVVYGPDEPGKFYGPSGFVKSVLCQEPITLWGDGNEYREFIFIDDVVNIVINLIFHNYSGIINVASGRSYTFQEILDIIERFLSLKLNINSRLRTKPRVDHRFNNALLKRLCPRVSFTSLEEGIHHVIEREKFLV